MKSLLLCIFILFSHAATSFELKPDTNKKHCEAFGGKWVQTKCNSRLEFQQKPIQTTLFSADYDQWCTERGGTMRKTMRGKRCQGAQSTQGMSKIPSLGVAKFKVHQDVVNSCITSRDIINTPCTVKATNSSNNWFNFTQKTNFVDTASVAVLLSWIQAITKLNYNHQIQRERNILISTLTNFVENKKLNSCQKACLIKCATSNILNYSSVLGTKYGSINNMYAKRGGMCSEFASIAKDLGRALGIPVKIAAGSTHAYNTFLIDGLWYYGDPQLSSCNFYHTKSSLFQYKKSFLPPVSQGDGGRTELKMFFTGGSEIKKFPSVLERYHKQRKANKVQGE